MNVGAEFDGIFFSSAHCCFAPSIWRRLLMQRFCGEGRRPVGAGIVIK
jgi:hypothetical protein